MSIRVVGLGAGGHARVVIDVLRAMGAYEIVGLLDANVAQRGTDVDGIPVLGGDDALATVYAQGVRHAFIGVGSVARTALRERLYALARSQHFTLISAVHPRAVVAPSATMGSGVTMMANAVVNASARLAENVVVNTSAVVEHDCVVDAHAYIATGALLCSAVQVGRGAHVGAGATIRQGLRIGVGAVIGAGAVVIRDVAAGTVVAGVPARPLQHPSRSADTHEAVASWTSR